MPDKIINHVVIDGQPGKFYAPNILTGLEKTETVSELKSELRDLEDIVYVTEDAFVWESILDKIVWEEGFVRLDGTTSSSSSYRKTQKMPVSSGDQFSFGGDNARFLTAYNGNVALSTSGAEYATSYTVPDGVDGVVMSFTPVTKPTAIWIRHSKQVINGNGIAKLDNDIQATTRKLSLRKPNNIIDPNNIDLGHFYNLKGEIGASSTYNCTNEPIPVNPTDVVRVYDGNELEVARYITAYDADMNALQEVGVENSSSYTVPDYVKFIKISWSASFSNVMVTINAEMLAYEPYFAPYYSATSDFLNGYYKNCKSANLLNPETLTDGMYIRQNGSSGSSSTYAVTDYIPVKQGDIISAFMGNNDAISFRYVTAYSASKMAIASLGAENVYTYTVPAGISYVRLSGNASYLKTDTCVITAYALSGKYQPYKENDPYKFTTDLYTATSDIYRFPLTSLPPYIIGLLSYRPLGSLSKGYVCLVSDDGDADVATYTIPMVISKGVPCTFAAMKSSTCWDNGSAQATVIDAVQNHGCEIAQHGGSSWLNYNEYILNHFFDKEKEFWDSLGLIAYGAVCPQHDINNTIRAVAGGRFGALRTGYISQYDFFNNGARSNVLGLSSQSSLDGGLASQKSALDDAYQNNRLRMIHWHENEMSADDKATLEGLIDYAKTLGLTFITMKDIPYIT